MLDGQVEEALLEKGRVWIITMRLSAALRYNINSPGGPASLRKHRKNTA